MVASALYGYRATRALSQSFGALMQAVWTGTTPATDERPEGTPVSLRELYVEFESLALSFIPEDRQEAVFQIIDDTPDGEPVNLSELYPDRQEDREEGEDRYSDDSDLLEAESELSDEDQPELERPLEGDIADWPVEEDIVAEVIEEYEEYIADLEESEAQEELRLRRAMRDEMRERLRTKIKIARRRRSEEIAEKRLERALAEARRKAAGEASKTALAGARDDTIWRGARSGRVYGWARVPGSARPCYFCLALISLGAFFTTEDTARSMTHGVQKGKEYHEHCHCEVMPVYSWEQYLSDPVFRFNRSMYKMWGELSGGHSGGLEDWRGAIGDFYDSGKDLAGIVRDNHARHS